MRSRHFPQPVLSEHCVVLRSMRGTVEIAKLGLCASLTVPILVWAASFWFLHTRDLWFAVGYVFALVSGCFTVGVVASLLRGGVVRFTPTTVLFVPFVGRPRWVLLESADAFRWGASLHVRLARRWYRMPIFSDGLPSESRQQIRSQLASWIDTYVELHDVLQTLRLAHLNWGRVASSFLPHAAIVLLFAFWPISLKFLPMEWFLHPAFLWFVASTHIAKWFALGVVEYRRARYSPVSIARIRLARRQNLAFQPVTTSISVAPTA
jgi:hypothetical protein